MKKIFFAMGVLLATSLSSSASAQCCDPCFTGCGNWYIGGFGGLNWVNKKGHSTHHKYKTGYIVGGDIGYKWDNGFRLEGEVSYRNNQRKHHGSSGHHKDKQTTAVMANGLYQFDIDCFPIDVYFGAGLGWVNTQNSHSHHNTNGSTSNHSRKNNGFAWQVIAGLAYPICENVDLDLEYRFFDETQSKFNNNSVDIGFRYYF